VSLLTSTSSEENEDEEPEIKLIIHKLCGKSSSGFGERPLWYNIYNNTFYFAEFLDKELKLGEEKQATNNSQVMCCKVFSEISDENTTYCLRYKNLNEYKLDYTQDTTIFYYKDLVCVYQYSGYSKESFIEILTPEMYLI
jgi:hypothetical protein